MSIMRCNYCEIERDTDFKSDCECEKSILIEEIIRIILPLVIAELLGYFNNIIDFNTVIFHATLLTIGILVSGICHHPYFYNIELITMKLRIALAGLVYREVFIFS